MDDAEASIRVAYTDLDGFPLADSYVIRQAGPVSPQFQERKSFDYEIRHDIEFDGAPDPKSYRLAYYGLPEPALFRPEPWPLWVWVVGGGVALLVIACAVRRWLVSA